MFKGCFLFIPATGAISNFKCSSALSSNYIISFNRYRTILIQVSFDTGSGPVKLLLSSSVLNANKFLFTSVSFSLFLLNS